MKCPADGGGFSFREEFLLLYAAGPLGLSAKVARHLCVCWRFARSRFARRRDIIGPLGAG
jgi:hypothetical protein